ncbi:hypothetical protein S83_066847, partial [Arachis hypogaea]
VDLDEVPLDLDANLGVRLGLDPDLGVRLGLDLDLGMGLVVFDVHLGLGASLDVDSGLGVSLGGRLDAALEGPSVVELMGDLLWVVVNSSGSGLVSSEGM